jgi:hypothetical protein
MNEIGNNVQGIGKKQQPAAKKECLLPGLTATILFKILAKHVRDPGQENIPYQEYMVKVLKVYDPAKDQDADKGECLRQ